MKIKAYLVGGAVRDRLLGLPVKEQDWVVVGATSGDMKRLGYRQVGRDFPVFLHPETHEEYALARRERKTGPGYTGFDFDTSPAVTLEEDLLRRDLTINAMAQAPDGTIIDPVHGREDLEARVLRHVSKAFVEDPVRILRVARFAARFAALGFHVAEETLTLMQTMVRSGEVDALIPERVWKELERALGEPHPEAFFEVLASCGALQVLFPDAFWQGQAALRAAVSLTEDPVIRFAAVLHGLDLRPLGSLCERFRVPNDYSQLAELVVRCFPQYQALPDADPEAIVQLLQDVDAFRRRERFLKWLVACEACQAGSGDNLFHDNKEDQFLLSSSRETKDQGHLGSERTAFLQHCFRVAATIDAAALSVGARGAEIAGRIYQARINAVAEFLRGSERCGTVIMRG